MSRFSPRVLGTALALALLGPLALLADEGDDALVL